MGKQYTIHKALITQKEKRFFGLSEAGGTTVLCGDNKFLTATSQDRFVTCEACLTIMAERRAA